MSEERAIDEGTPVSEQEPDRSLSLTVQTERRLEHLILTGELQPGERLNELELSQRFGISRGPLRESMQALHAKGLVEMIRNRGVFVRAISTDEAMELYDVRAAVFGLAGRILTDRVNDELLARMHQFLDELEVLAQARNFDDYYRLNLAFHDYLINATGNSTLVAEYRGFVNKLHLCRARGLVQAGGLAVSNREHREMVDAIASGDKLRAQEAFFRHVERAKLRFRSTVEQSANRRD
ncbi:FCD domain-containing protein [Aliigemmobacter aestuarii]|uniref:FCD domain-containing protein n=1 Tax=Aliigemmobacter aestuarii TaxID=1445661 RepID=UPI001B3B1DE0|nr:FCD domain-containing protein [Gemmobacter aestuarii]